MSWDPEESRSLSSQSVQGVKWTFLQSWGGQVINLLIFILLARLLEPRVFGIVAIAAIFIALSEAILEQGLGAAIIQRKEITKDHLDAAFWLQLALGLVLASLLASLAPLAAKIFHETQVAPVLRGLSVALAIGALSRIQTAVLRRRLKFASLAARTLVASTVGGVVGISMAALGFGVWSLVGQQVASRTAAVIVLWSISSWRPSPRVSLSRLRELYSFGINVTGTQLLDFLNTRSDDFLIGYFLGPVSLGYYSVAYRGLRVMIQLFVQTTSAVALPAFSRVQGDRDRLTSGFYRGSRLISFVSFPIFGCILIFSGDLVRLGFGDKWIPVVPVMQVLTFLALLQSVTYLNTTVLMSFGRPRLVLMLDTINTSANLVAFYIAVRWGIFAVATAFVIRGYLVIPLRLFIGSRVVGWSVRNYLGSLVSPAAAAVTMSAGILILDRVIEFGTSLLRLAILGPLALVIYLSALAVIKREQLTEGLSVFRQMMMRKDSVSKANSTQDEL